MCCGPGDFICLIYVVTFSRCWWSSKSCAFCCNLPTPHHRRGLLCAPSDAGGICRVGDEPEGRFIWAGCAGGDLAISSGITQNRAGDRRVLECRLIIAGAGRVRHRGALQTGQRGGGRGDDGAGFLRSANYLDQAHPASFPWLLVAWRSRSSPITCNPRTRCRIIR